MTLILPAAGAPLVPPLLGMWRAVEASCERLVSQEIYPTEEQYAADAPTVAALVEEITDPMVTRCGMSSRHKHTYGLSKCPSVDLFSLLRSIA